MSFLSSVLNSISKGDRANSAPTPSSKAPPASTSATIGIKRKAETGLERPENKVQRTGEAKAPRDIKPLPQRPDRPPAPATGAKPSIGVRPAVPSQQNDAKTDRAPQSPGVATSKPAANQKPGALQRTTSGLSAKSTSGADSKRAVQTSRQAAGAPAAAVTQAAQPKKGSFKDLMNRAKAAQTVAVGKILHKPAERLGKKERMALNKGKALRGKEPPAPPAKAVVVKQVVGKNGKPLQKPAATPAGAAKYQGTSKPKVSARPSYQGTAKPVAKPAYRGTSKANAVPPSSRNTKPAKRVDRNEYLGTDEEDEAEYGYDSEGQYTENSEDFSDMDAGFDEIGDEEEEAERQAKRDDVKEQRLLDKLAREKAERKKGRF